MELTLAMLQTQLPNRALAARLLRAVEITDLNSVIEMQTPPEVSLLGEYMRWPAAKAVVLAKVCDDQAALDRLGTHRAVSVRNSVLCNASTSSATRITLFEEAVRAKRKDVAISAIAVCDFETAMSLFPSIEDWGKLINVNEAQMNALWLSNNPSDEELEERLARVLSLNLKVLSMYAGRFCAARRGEGRELDPVSLADGAGPAREHFVEGYFKKLTILDREALDLGLELGFDELAFIDHIDPAVLAECVAAAPELIGRWWSLTKDPSLLSLVLESGDPVAARGVVNDLELSDDDLRKVVPTLLEYIKEGSRSRGGVHKDALTALSRASGVISADELIETLGSDMDLSVFLNWTIGAGGVRPERTELDKVVAWNSALAARLVSGISHVDEDLARHVFLSCLEKTDDGDAATTLLSYVGPHSNYFDDEAIKSAFDCLMRLVSTSSRLERVVLSETLTEAFLALCKDDEERFVILSRCDHTAWLAHGLSDPDLAVRVTSVVGPWVRRGWRATEQERAASLLEAVTCWADGFVPDAVIDAVIDEGGEVVLSELLRDTTPSRAKYLAHRLAEIDPSEWFELIEFLRRSHVGFGSALKAWNRLHKSDTNT